MPDPTVGKKMDHEKNIRKILKASYSFLRSSFIKDLLQSRDCQEKQSRETQTLKSLRSTTKYKRNTDSEFLQKIRNTKKNNENQ